MGEGCEGVGGGSGVEVEDRGGKAWGGELPMSSPLAFRFPIFAPVLWLF